MKTATSKRSSNLSTIRQPNRSNWQENPRAERPNTIRCDPNRSLDLLAREQIHGMEQTQWCNDQNLCNGSDEH